jgi:hypothetical protein
VIYNSRRPGKFLVALNDLLEGWRWLGGTIRAYLVSLLSILFLFPLRNFIPAARSGDNFKSGLVDLTILIPEILFLQRWKKLGMLRYFLEQTPHKFILLITPSCYIHKHYLMKTLRTLPEQENIYAGPLKENHDCKFISGAGLILNRNMAKTILENRNRIPTHTMDDVGIGVLASKLNIEPIPLDAISIADFRSLKSIFSGKRFYVRLKSGSINNRSDAKLMRELHKVYREG